MIKRAKPIPNKIIINGLLAIKKLLVEDEISVTT